MTSRILDNGSRGNTGNISNMFFLSLLLHLIIIAVILMSVPTVSRKLTFGPAYSVALVGPEVMLSSKDPANVKDMLGSGPKENPIVLKKEFSKSSSTPIFKEDSGNLNIEKAIKAIKQKDQRQQETGKADRKTLVTAPQTRTNSAVSGQDSRISEYTSFIWSKVKKNWALPSALMPKEKVETIIDVRIARSGTMEYIGFEKRSGNAYFDDSALKAVNKSAPFPPLPEWITGSTIEIGIRFHSEELRR
jgi:colicin import membrane protein